MARPRNPPHARVLFELVATRADGAEKVVLSGYRPAYDVKPDYWTTMHHDFEGGHEVRTGCRASADVWFITPEAYPGTLWPGRVINVAEGSRIVGMATIEQVFNSVLMKPADL